MPTPPKEHQFKKGQSGNPKGKAPGKSIRTLLREAAVEKRKAIVDAMLALATHDIRAAEWCAKWADDPSAANLTFATREFTLRISTPERDSDDA